MVRTLHGIILVVCFMALIFSGCTAQNDPNEQPTPTATDTVNPTELPGNPVPTRSFQQSQLILKDSAQMLNPNEMDKVLIITNNRDERIYTEELEIHIQDDDNEKIDVLKFNPALKRFNGEYLRSEPFSYGEILPGKSITIIEKVGFNIRSDSILRVSIIDTVNNQSIVDGKLKVI